MPPLPSWYRGVDTVGAFVRAVPLGSCGQWRALEATANAQPAVALYRRTDGNRDYRAWSLNVLDVQGGSIGAVTSFIGVEVFAGFGLPMTL